MGNKNGQKLVIELDTSELTAAQIRTLRTVNTVLIHLLVTKEEGEFFENSSELMRLCATIIKQASFPHESHKKNKIAYADQALEYSLDNLHEQINTSKIISYDN